LLGVGEKRLGLGRVAEGPYGRSMDLKEEVYSVEFGGRRTTY